MLRIKFNKRSAKLYSENYRRLLKEMKIPTYMKKMFMDWKI